MFSQGHFFWRCCRITGIIGCWQYNKELPSLHMDKARPFVTFSCQRQAFFLLNVGLFQQFWSYCSGDRLDLLVLEGRVSDFGSYCLLTRTCRVFHNSLPNWRSLNIWCVIGQWMDRLDGSVVRSNVATFFVFNQISKPQGHLC